MEAATPHATEQSDGSGHLSDTHWSNTYGNNVETINFEETARSDVAELPDEMTRLDVKQQERDSYWQGDIPQPSNGGGVQQAESVKNERVEQSGVEQTEVEQREVEQSGVEQSGVEQSREEWSEQECISIERTVRERKESGYARDISRECEGRECKRKLESKWIDKTQQEFRTMQEVLGEYDEENGDERLVKLNHFIPFLLKKICSLYKNRNQI